MNGCNVHSLICDVAVLAEGSVLRVGADGSQEDGGGARSLRLERRTTPSAK
jgi:hypothetical protein